MDEHKRLAHVYLFTSKNFHDTSCSLNQQLADSNLWNQQKDVFLSSRGPSKSLNVPTNPATIQTSSLSTDGLDKAPHTPKRMSSPLGSQSAPPGSPSWTASSSATAGAARDWAEFGCVCFSGMPSWALCTTAMARYVQTGGFDGGDDSAL